MNTTLLTTLSFLLFALTTYFPLVFTEYVYDTNGNPLTPGAKYYIEQTTTSGQKGGGLMLSLTGGITACPLTVLQQFCEDDDEDLRLPVKFNVSDGDVISEDLSNLGIEFYSKSECAQSSKWVVVENDNYFHTKWISIGNVEDLGDHIYIVDGVFKIKKQGLGYKLVFFSKRVSYDIARFNDRSGRRLVANTVSSYPYHPFEVKFINANRYGNGRSVV